MNIYNNQSYIGLSAAEQHKILVEWNHTQTDYPKDQCIHQLFEAQVERTPNAIAVVFENQQLTYHELNRSANQLAHYLQSLGVSPEGLVGLCVEPCLAMVVGLLAILKAGGAYVPLDPTYPKERLAFMLAGVPVFLTQQKLIDNLPEHQAQVVCLETDWGMFSQENIVSEVRSEDLVYVIYTSGSTGQPKGTSLCHRGFTNLVNWLVSDFKLTAADSVLIISAFSFDLTQKNFFAPLIIGGRLYLLPQKHYEPTVILQAVYEQKITWLNCTPTAFYPLIALNTFEKLASLRYLFLGGESISLTRLLPWLQSCQTKLVNTYGPTEATDVCAAYLLEQPTQFLAPAMPIGKPIFNVELFILSKQLERLPIGMAGELYIGGVGLARGYLNRPDLTSEKFIANPFSENPHSRLYRTGDLARYLPDGNIEYLGRIDHQTKIRGFRIELGEIEAVLAQYPLVKENAVVVHEVSKTDKRLVAYLVLHHQQVIENAVLRAFLTGLLPDYMIPATFVTKPSLPLTPNGKIDRQALSQLSVSYERSDKQLVAPQTAKEKWLTDIWVEVLGVKQVCIHDNFFELGGDSLLATQVISRIRDTFEIELPQRKLFECPTIASLSEQLTMTNQESLLPPITRVDRDKLLPLSFAQRRLWFLAQLENQRATYHLPMAFHLEGPLHQQALEHSFQTLVERHDSLRTSFPSQNGIPSVQISDQPFQLAILDLRALSSSEQDLEVQRLLKKEVIFPFDLETEPLFRTTLIQLEISSHILLLNMHHIISDGWSLGVLVRELGLVYEATLKGHPSPLPPLPIQYVDFTHWQRQWLTGEVLETQVKYWQQQLAGMPTLLELPTDYPRPPRQRFYGASLSFSLSTELTNRLKQLSQQMGATIFMTLWSAFAILLSRYSGQADIVVGSPIANRHHTQTESLIGFFVNTLVLRLDLANNPRFKKVLKQARRVALEAYNHQDIPFEQLVEALQPERHLSHSPLFQVMFVLQNTQPPDLELVGLNLTPLALDIATAQFDLTLEFTETTAGLMGRLEYNTDLFKKTTIERLFGCLQTLLTGMVENPNTSIHELPLLTQVEQQQLLAWNDTTTDYPQDRCIHQLFEAQVEKTPEAIAVIFEKQQLTYRALNTQANQLAHYLQILGVKPEVLVGICLERSCEMVIGLFGILKAGGAYVPLDPTYPAERLAFMLEDAGVTVLLTQSSLKDKLPETKAQMVCLDVEAKTLSQLSSENLKSGVVSENLAYVIYTSGSTGKPKGTLIIHQGLTNYLSWALEYYQVAKGLGVPVHSPLGFDATITSLFLPLLVGQRILLISVSPEAEAILTVIQSFENWSFIKLTPAHLEILNTLLPKQELLDKTRFFILGGEALFASSLLFWISYTPETRIINEYGPTETVVGCCVYEVNTKTPKEGAVPIGRPIANTQLYILDNFLQPLPIGVAGELYIGGIGLARGYLNRPDLTAEKFLSNPFSSVPNSRLYKTGDLARYLPDGNLEYLGRIDNQVKIRGFRIELGEIEAVLTQHPLVKKNAVVIHEVSKTDKHLVAYLVLHQEAVIENSALCDFLSAQLPNYMIPHAFIRLENLPLTSNGKIDHRALVGVELRETHQLSLSKKTFVTPRDVLELQLTQIWEAILNVNSIGVQDSFFEMGGHSLLAVRLMAEIQQQFGQTLSLATLFQGATIEQLAKIIRQQTNCQAWSPLVAIQPHGTKPSFFCMPGSGGNVYYFHQLARHLGTEQPFYALQARGLDGKSTPFTCVEEIAGYYLEAIKKIQPQGPYLLGGHSFGALVAFEMAQQLQQQGQQVALLAILDLPALSPNRQPLELDWDNARWMALIAHILETLSGKTLGLSLKNFQALDTEAGLKLLKERLANVNLLPIDADINTVRSLVQVIKADELAFLRYVPPVNYPNQMTLFKTSESYLDEFGTFGDILDEPDWGWGYLSTKPIEVVMVPGNHTTMLTEPHVQVLAEKLRKWLF